MSVVLLASADVDGFGGREARKSPYAGESCSLTSKQLQLECHECWEMDGKRTIDGLALRQVAIVLAGEQGIAIATDNALDVAVKILAQASRTVYEIHTRI